MLHRGATKEREEIKRTTKQKMARRHNRERGNYLDQESNKQKTMEDTDGGLRPAVDEQSLGERRQVWKCQNASQCYSFYYMTSKAEFISHDRHIFTLNGTKICSVSTAWTPHPISCWSVETPARKWGVAFCWSWELLQESRWTENGIKWL